MSAFRSALTDLIVTAVAARLDLEEAYACSQAVLEELPASDDQEFLPGLRRLSEAILLAPLGGAGVLGLTGSAIVESGGPPGVMVKAVVERMQEALEGGLCFLHACQRRAGAERSATEAVQEHGEAVAQRSPGDALAWNAIETLGLTLLTLLRDPGCRERVNEAVTLHARLLPLRAAHPHVAEILQQWQPDVG